MKQLRRFLCLSFVLLLCSSLPTVSQSLPTRAEPRLKGPITDASRAALPHSRTPRPQSAEDRGAVLPQMAVPGITLVFRRSAAQEAGLQQLLAAQQNSASPLYRHWLTPEDFAARYGVAEQDLAATESWLISRGFQIEGVARSRDRITFSGTAGQIQGAFGTELHHYRADGESHFAPASDLFLPAELAPVTAAVLHLSDFRPRPSVKAQIEAETRGRPDYTALSNQAHYLVPADIATLYDLNPLYQQNLFGGGQRLAVVGQSYLTSPISPVQTFQLNLTQPTTIIPVLVPNSGVEAISQGDEGESEIDLEYSSGIAQKATIFLVYVGDNQNYSVFDSLAFAITQNIAPVVSISYGGCEASFSQSDIDQQNALFEEAAAQGQTLVAAAGDNGSTACAYYTSADGVTPAQQQALSVSFPASSPYVISVGGTQMAPGTFVAGTSPYWAPAGTADNNNSLLSYVPETVWNESSTFFGISAGGGGSSAVFSRPAWQTGFPGIPSGAGRLVPDVALQSSIQSPGFLICTDDLGLLRSDGQSGSCVAGLNGSNNKYTIAGGTSFATPIFAGFLAILNQLEQTQGMGNINPTLYSLAANPATYAAAFHDIATGTNACPSTVQQCPAAGQSNYAATPGYDEATGLGSVDFNALANVWPASAKSSLIATTASLAGAVSAAPGATVPVQINIESAFQPGGAPSPTGFVTVSVDGALVDPALALSPDAASFNSLATYNFVTPSAPGSHLLSVTYPGDATHSSSTATYAVLVGNVFPSGSVTLAVGNLAVANNATGTTLVTASPGGGYGGRLVWSISIAKGSGPLTACFTLAPLDVSSTSTAQLTIGVGSVCTVTLPASPTALRPLIRLASANDDATGRGSGAPAAVLYASLFFCGMCASRKRRAALRSFVALLVLAGVGAGLTGCGGGSGGTGNTGNSSTPAAAASSYTLTLTGTDSVNTSIIASTNFVLTVN